jgi:hypothetical protein
MPILSIEPEQWLLGAYPHVNHPEKLLEAVELALHPTAGMYEKLKQYRHYFFTGLDGKSGQRVKAKIDELIR